MELKNVLVNYTGRKGGGAVYSYEMVKSLVEKKVNVYAIISEDVENVKEWDEIKGLRLFKVKTYSNKYNFIINTLRFIAFDLPKIRKQLLNVKIDSIYLPMIQPWSILINTAFKASKQIVTMHDPMPHSGAGKFYSKYCDYMARKSSELIILSEVFKEYSIRQFSKKEKNIHIIPHGVFDYYKKVQTDDSVEIYKSGNVNLLFFGLITEYKGLNILAEAYEYLKKEHEQITLTIVGNGDFEKYKSKFDRLDDVNVINRWISDEEVGRYFDYPGVITILPYTDATQSGVIPIAMNYNSIVIASNTGGLSEQVSHKETGYLVEPNNPIKLYEMIKYVIENPDEHRQIKKSAQEYIESLSWSNLSEKLYRIL